MDSNLEREKKSKINAPRGIKKSTLQNKLQYLFFEEIRV